MNYNLLVERWIPVLGTDGKPRRVGIQEALMQAGQIREVRHSSPLVTFGIYRLLVTVLKWLGPSERQCDWAQAWHQSGVPCDVLAKLDQPEYSKVFDIFNPVRPFFQGAKEFSDLQKLGLAPDRRKLTDAERERMKTAAYLVTEIPTKTYKAHFWHANDETTRVCTTCCVCGLLTLPPFCTGVGQGNETSINNVPPVYWLVHGERLLDTLLLNIPDGEIEDDAPCWAGDGAGDQVGPLEGMTWQPRRIALYPYPVVGERCSRCGEVAAEENLLVKWIIFSNRATTKAEDPRLAKWIDPHIGGEFEKTMGQIRFLGLAPDVAPGAWCKRVQFLLSPSQEGKSRRAPNVTALPSRVHAPARYEAVAYMLHSNRAEFEHWQEERWPISPAMVGEPFLRDRLLIAARQASVVIQDIFEEWPKRIWRLRYPGSTPRRNDRNAWKKGASRAAIRSAITELDRRLKNWFQAQMRVIAEGEKPELLADLPRICRELGHNSVATIVASLSPTASPLERARIEREAEALVEDAVRKAERIPRKGRKPKP